jgi:alpha-D-ribose 1-methylphosphonate 5-triphosphate synthase subunit PhnI
MYVAVKGGEAAIEAAHEWMAHERRGDPSEPRLSLGQIEGQLGLAVDRVMSEGSCHDRELAALAIRQARGDLIEAAFLLRAHRNTLSRFVASEPLDTGAMRVKRRISATYKDLPGRASCSGPTFDYTHRCYDCALAAEPPPPREDAHVPAAMPRVTSSGPRWGPDGARGPRRSPAAPPDLTPRAPALSPRPPAAPPVPGRGDEGFLLGLGYSTQRGYGNAHPFVAKLRVGEAECGWNRPSWLCHLHRRRDRDRVPDGQPVAGSAAAPPQFTRGYGLVIGHNERKAMAMALVDRALMARELGEDATSPAQDEEFVLLHADNIEATGFVEHLKLPHHVDFQSELEKLRSIRARWEASRAEPEAGATP